MKVSPCTSVLIVGIVMVSRTISISRNSVSPSRYIVSVTVVPFSPRIRSTASSILMPSVEVSSIRMSTSPAMIPACSAGVSGSGAITVMRLSRIPTSIPTPLKLPEMSSANDSASSGSRNEVYGSPYDFTNPSIAPQTRSWFDATSTSPLPTYFSSSRFQTRQNAVRSASVSGLAAVCWKSQPRAAG